MPLFVCEKCGCLENSHLVNKNLLETKYNYRNMIPGEMVPEFYPCMDLRDMHGHGESNILLNGQIWKDVKETRMLCSECNTGTWHGEFYKDTAMEQTKLLSTFSKLNYVTPFDHDNEAFVKVTDIDSTSDCGYIPNLEYTYLHNLFKKTFDINYNTPISDGLKDLSKKLKPSPENYGMYKKLNSFSLLFNVFKEERENFHLYLQGGFDHVNLDWEDPRDVSLIILDSIVDMNKANGLVKIILEYHNKEELVFLEMVQKYQMGFFNKVNKKIIQGPKKPHWKETQSETEKNEKLRKAEEKRLRKQQRK